MCAAVFVAGATLDAISPVSLALQGVVMPKRDLGRANASGNAAYAAGMLLGPPISRGVLFTRLGGGAMLLHLAALWAVFVVFTAVFASDDPHRAKRRLVGAVNRASLGGIWRGRVRESKRSSSAEHATKAIGCALRARAASREEETAKAQRRSWTARCALGPRPPRLDAAR